MRRALSTLVLLALCLPALAPAFIAGANRSDLPACCRRNGAHHCMMRGVSVAVPPRYRTIAPICPYCSAGRVLLMLPHALAQQSAPAAAYSVHPAAMVREAESGYRISWLRSRQKRGPPALYLL